MTQKEEKLVEKVSNIEPLDRRVLVYPHKLRTYKDKAFKAEPVDPESDPMDPDREMRMEEVVTDVNYRYQKATVLKLPENTIKVQPGDVVIYEVGKLKEFDLVKGVSILREYDIEFIER